MDPSTCDRKKAEIVRHAEIECSAETNKAKAIYELKCLELEKKYEAMKEQACHDLEQQKRGELGEIKRLHEAEMEPIKARNARKLSEIRDQYRIAAPEAALRASASSETPSSPTLVTASQRLTNQQQAEAGNKDTAANNRSIDDTQESGDETDTSIPPFAPQATSKAAFAAPMKKRKRPTRIDDSENEESDFSQNENKNELVDNSDASSPGSQERPPEWMFNPFRRASTQGSGRNTEPSASPTRIRNPSKRLNQADSSSHKTEGQTDGGDKDEGIYNGPASQASRRNQVRSGRPEPGKYRMNAKAWPV